MFKVLAFLLIAKCVQSVSLIEHTDIRNESSVRGPKILTKSAQRDVFYIKPQMQTSKLFWQYYNSYNPITVLVDDVKDTKMHTYNFLKNIYSLNPELTQKLSFQLMLFNHSGTSDILASTEHDLNNFFNLLTTDNTFTSQLDGIQNKNGTSLYFALLNAITKSERSSGILVFLDRLIKDEEFSQLVYKEARNKDIKIYVIWSSYSTLTKQERVLDEVCTLTGGKFLINENRNLSSLNYRMFIEGKAGNVTPSLILTKFNLLGEQTVSFPIDSDVTGIHINVNPVVTSGSITTPRGTQLDIFDNEAISKYGTGSFCERNEKFHQVHLNTRTTPTLDVGIWTINLYNAHVPYNLTIYAFTQLTFDVYVAQNNLSTDFTALNNIVKLNVSGDVKKIDKITLVKESGQEITENIQIDNSVDDHEQLTTTNSREINLKLQQLPNETFYAILHGKDSKGKDFARVSYVKQMRASTFPQQPLIVDVGLGSELITSPARYINVYFEVTNNADRPNNVRFGCADQKYFLTSMQPYNQVISPGETATVRVTLYAKYAAQDELTFYATGSLGSAEKRAIVDIGTASKVYDDSDPDINYDFTSDCTSVLIGDCRTKSWTVEIRAKDTESGLLQVSTRPAGIYFPNGFTVGTKDEVTGSYSDSCCNDNLQITAVDRSNNRRTRNINPYKTLWSAGAIAALVLGILLFILLIALIVWAIVRCRNERGSFYLPTYRGGKY